MIVAHDADYSIRRSLNICNLLACFTCFSCCIVDVVVDIVVDVVVDVIFVFGDSCNVRFVVAVYFCGGGSGSSSSSTTTLTVLLQSTLRIIDKLRSVIVQA